jgi:hydrogenase maturation protease
MLMKAEKSVLVLGVGNILLGDEGLGVRVTEYIKDHFCLPPEVSVMDGGTGGLSLLRLLRDYDSVIIVDAVASRSSPGALYRIPASELPKAPPLMTTAHQLGVMDLLSLASLDGYNPEVVIIGMEPLDISPGLELSPLVKLRLPLIAQMVREELRRFGVADVTDIN